ncbi:MAG: 50S ribosomal protein L11 methyltransferase [Acidobacteria bacterium]|nr:50S ribosomal protein L11 methyltransferase [Acidobacteriota bacterium]
MNDGLTLSGLSAGATLRVRFDIDPDLEDDLAEILNRHSSMGASLVSRADGRVGVDVYFGPNDGALIPDLVDALFSIGVLETEVGTQEAEDWLAAYRDSVRPFVVGRSWWIDPHPGVPTPAPAGFRRLVVEPRMAFGTGSHQSTALVLMELESRLPERLTVLDVGTGSGILALAALRLGAAWVAAFDLDLEAVMVARQIKRDQDFPCAPAYFAGTWSAIGSAAFDLIVCNMISEHFLPMAGSLRKLMSANGSAVFSGILDSEAEEVSEALGNAGYRMLSVRALDEWVAFRVTHGD